MQVLDIKKNKNKKQNKKPQTNKKTNPKHQTKKYQTQKPSETNQPRHKMLNSSASLQITVKITLIYAQAFT